MDIMLGFWYVWSVKYISYYVGLYKGW